jgi:hypothetical protein
MKNSNFTKFFSQFWCLFILLYLTTNCKDKCNVTQTYTNYIPVYKSLTEIRTAPMQIKSAKNMQKVGKIYAWGTYIFINEVDKGIHIIQNINPSSPQNIGFLPIEGNKDMAVKQNTLYADSYIDLVVFDLSNPNNPKFLKRLENVFPDYYSYHYDQSKIITEWKSELITQKLDADCNSGALVPVWWDGLMIRDAQGGIIQMNASSANNLVNKAGSMARFAVYQDYLYALGRWHLHLFDIKSQQEPQSLNQIPIWGGVETLFPYKDKLFIGAQTGMFIYDNSVPSEPTFLGQFTHARVCDPVVVEDKYAYVTLRSGNFGDGLTPVFCGNDLINQLNVIDIQDLVNPTLVKAYPMQSPYGLGIDRKTLFVCEGDYGLKIFDANDPKKITDHKLAHFKDIHAYDVIPLGEVLLAIGEDGLYQYNYSNPQNIRLLSKIPIIK